MSELLTVERNGHILMMGVNRPDKANAWNVEIIQGVARAYSELTEDDELRVGVVFGHGKHFTAGLDLMDVAPYLADGEPDAILPPGSRDPWDYVGEPCPKPIVLAVHGRCFTLGVELALASQYTVAAADTTFNQAEVSRGIFPFGGGAHRLPAKLGTKGMGWLLTASDFSAAEALDAGLINESVEPGTQLDRAVAVAEKIASNAPKSVQAALAISRSAERAAREAARTTMVEFQSVLTSEDAMEGMMAMMEKRPPVFKGQ